MNKGEAKHFKKAIKQKRPYTDDELEDLYDSKDESSGRYMTRIGTIKEMKLLDKIIFPINTCPHCKSNETFHERMQTKNIEKNVFRESSEVAGLIRRLEKWDLCLKCQRQFLIEVYIWRHEN